MKRPRVLVLGSGAREHALARALGACADVTVCPGNDGMAADATPVPGDLRDPAHLMAVARECTPDLVVVGPEEPLVNGVADLLRGEGFAVLGPGREAACLEGSKVFMKEVAAAAGVPTARHAAFEDEDAALDHLGTVGAPIVVKADGLAAGKGVTVCELRGEAENAIRECFLGRFGRAGARVVLEERLEGPEISVFVLCDAEGTVRYLGDAQDHKRLGDGDRGPNTGGMGAFSPSPLMDADRREEVVARFVRPTLDELRARDIPFRGILFCGLILTADGLKLLEYNVRLGDPEAQVVLPRIDGDLYELFLAAAEDRLARTDEPTLSGDATCAVVLAAPGYPNAPRKGDAIGGLDRDGRLTGHDVLHAATTRDGGRWLADGGRVLSVPGRGGTIREAREAAYRGVGALDWPEALWRHDIAAAYRDDPANDILAQGKTKRIVRGERPGTVRLKAIDRLTGGDAARVAEIDAIGRAKTAQAAHCFTLLNGLGIPTAFIERADETTLLCRDCEMLPLEFVVRRYAFGSFLKRRPDMATVPPLRFDAPVHEIFHKHGVVVPPASDAPRQIEEGEARRRFLRDGSWAEGVHTDPFVVPDTASWALHGAKAPVEGEPLMRIAPTMSEAELREARRTILRPAFDALERAWAAVETRDGPVHLVDIKFELGRDRETGALLLADVVDNDAWRIWPGGDPQRQLDKQAFRDGAGDAEVAANYDLVARLTERFATPAAMSERGA